MDVGPSLLQQHWQEMIKQSSRMNLARKQAQKKENNNKEKHEFGWAMTILD